jgi:hypothetical protein
VWHATTRGDVEFYKYIATLPTEVCPIQESPDEVALAVTRNEATTTLLVSFEPREAQAKLIERKRASGSVIAGVRSLRIATNRVEKIVIESRESHGVTARVVAWLLPDRELMLTSLVVSELADVDSADAEVERLLERVLSGLRERS